MTEELDRDRPLFNDEVAVQVKFPDHEKTLALTVRVLKGSRLAPVGSGGGQREGVLHIEVTDELDPFFLYTLQVGLRCLFSRLRANKRNHQVEEVTLLLYNVTPNFEKRSQLLFNISAPCCAVVRLSAVSRKKQRR